MSKRFQEALEEFDHVFLDGTLELTQQGERIDLAPLQGWGGGPYRWMYLVRLLGVLVFVTLWANPNESLGMRALNYGLAAWWAYLGISGHIRYWDTRASTLRAVWDEGAGMFRIEMNGRSALAREVRIAAQAYGNWMSYWVKLPGRPAMHLFSSGTHAPPVISRYFADLARALGCGFEGVVRKEGAAVAPVTGVIAIGAALGAAMPTTLTPLMAGLLSICTGVLGAVWGQRRIRSTLAAKTSSTATKAVYWQDPRDGEVRTLEVSESELIDQPFLRLRNQPDAIVLGPSRYSRNAKKAFALGAISVWALSIAAFASSLAGVHVLSLSVGMWLNLIGTLLMIRSVSLDTEPVKTKKRSPVHESAYRTAEDMIALELTDEPLRFIYRAPRFGTLADLWVQKNGRISRVGEIEVGFENERIMQPIVTMVRSLDPRASLRSITALVDRGWWSTLSTVAVILIAWCIPNSMTDAAPLSVVGILFALIPSIVAAAVPLVIRVRARAQVHAAFERW